MKMNEFEMGDILVQFDSDGKWVVARHFSGWYMLFHLPVLDSGCVFHQEYVEGNFVKVGRWNDKMSKEEDDDEG